MRKQFKLRFAEPTERAKVTARLKANPANELDESILSYPMLQTIVAQDGGEEHYLPVQQVLMLESISDGMDPIALRDLVKGAELVASSHSIREIYFLDGAGGIGKIAANHGFEELPYKVYRMRLCHDIR